MTSDDNNGIMKDEIMLKHDSDDYIEGYCSYIMIIDVIYMVPDVDPLSTLFRILFTNCDFLNICLNIYLLDH